MAKKKHLVHKKSPPVQPEIQKPKVSRTYWKYIGVALFIILVFIIIKLIVIKPSSYKLSDMVVNQVGNNDVLTFNIENQKDLPADCTGLLKIAGKEYKFLIGIVLPNRQKVVKQQISFPNGDSKFELSAECVWQPMSVQGCEGTTFKLCNLFKANQRLQQCNKGAIADQYFCTAYLLSNPSYCNDILSEPRKTHCQAFVQNKPDICENLVNAWRDWCYEDYGINKQDESVCAKIQDADKQAACVGVTTHDIDVCKTISETEKLKCVLQLAEYDHNKSYCDLMIDSASCYNQLSWMT